MLDPKLIREQKEETKRRLATRGGSMDSFESYCELDSKWRVLGQEVDALKAERNNAVPKGKPTDEQRESLKRLSSDIKEKQEQLTALEASMESAASQLPNVPDQSVPVGVSEEDNVVIREEGVPSSFSFPVLSHDQVGANCGILDFDKAAQVTGSRFVYMKGQGARLERALINFMLDMHTERHGYQEVLPQAIVNSAALFGTGQLPKFSEDLFKLEGTDYWLSPTAEVQLTNLYQDTVIPESELPIQVTAQTPCFRSEAGSYGKDVKGLIRLHQFNKVELVQVVHPEQSATALDQLLGHAEEILKALNLPYRVVSLCTGDIGFSAGKTYDLEVWFPSQNAYREISSCSNFFDFQSRRAMIRYKSKDSGKTRYAHTLNGSGLAVGRTLAAILENYQCEDGSVRIPEELQPYTGFDTLCRITKNT